jgi:hypothetical protein
MMPSSEILKSMNDNQWKYTMQNLANRKGGLSMQDQRILTYMKGSPEVLTQPERVHGSRLMREALKYITRMSRQQFGGYRPREVERFNNFLSGIYRCMAGPKKASQPAKMMSIHPQFSWREPDLGYETGELHRTADTLGLDKKKLMAAAKRSKPYKLDDATWEALENTESFHDVRPGHMKDAEKIARKYNRDIGSIQEAFSGGSSLPEVLILRRGGKAPYLIEGNTRLMAARALKHRPRVRFVDYSE